MSAPATPAPTLRERLAARERLVGAFVIELPVRAVPEAYALAGFDFLVLDLEHADTSLERLSLLIASARAAGVGTLVRIEAGGWSSLTRVLDLHPDGVMVPGVASVEEVEEVVRRARFAPLGERGLAPMVRHAAAVGTAYGELDARVALVVQVEGVAAVEQAAAIASVDGVDGVFVGPYDLSQALGVPGQLDHPQVLEAGARVAEAVLSHAALGVYVSDAAAASPWRELGASFFTHGTDGQMLLRACRAARAGWDEAASEALART
ncbi:MAG: hypothetical protein JSS99_00205 [Actinobacteria bacterium]|nr:hypothetical protein [Actinomycetota bacterium]